MYRGLLYLQLMYGIYNWCTVSTTDYRTVSTTGVPYLQLITVPYLQLITVPYLQLITVPYLQLVYRIYNWCAVDLYSCTSGAVVAPCTQYEARSDTQGVCTVNVPYVYRKYVCVRIMYRKYFQYNIFSFQ